MRQSALVILTTITFSWLLRAEGSVVFPRDNDLFSRVRRNPRTREDGQSRKSQRLGLTKDPPMSNFQRRQSQVPVAASYQRMHLAFSGVNVIGRSGPWLVAAVALAQVANCLRSEALHRAAHFWVKAGPIVAHYKFTRWWLRKTKAPLAKRDDVYNILHNRYCNPSLDIVLDLKGLYVKIAQIVSSRPDFVPPQYIELFVAAQDSIPQWPIDQVVNILDESLQKEFGLRFDDVFDDIDPIALGSASIGQVHRATIKQQFADDGDYTGGKTVAVKVMHPGAEERFHHDFQVFRSLCKVAMHGWQPILDECYRQIMSEFDYRQEAGSLDTIRQGMSNSPYWRRIRIPQPLPSLCTKNVLVMEMLHGKKLADSLEDELAEALGGDKDMANEFIARKRLELILGKENSEMLRSSREGELKNFVFKHDLPTKLRLLSLYRKTQRYINLLVDVQGHQILVDGIFNGDPHPGNLLAMKDGSLGLVDFGQTKTITDDERLGVARVVAAIGKELSVSDIADAMRSLGFQTKFNDDGILAQYAALFFDSDIEGKRMGCATPQLYFSQLTKTDPLVNVPDVAIFVARTSFILRGMGTLLDKQICTSVRWSSQASKALGI